VKRPTSTAVSKTLEPQNPKAVCKMEEGFGVVSISKAISLMFTDSHGEIVVQ
jgi:hypothetical protein